ncbi:hypothetical protein HK098_005129 [Nowakowskiella sp. JEL0407]|nr:hypothetical protein HK098_005129 [Nowakowskiella sp. JEL0407]
MEDPILSNQLRQLRAVVPRAATAVTPTFDIFRNLMPDWVQIKSLCGNGVCDREAGEWCRTCPKDCPCTVNCGNGICDDGENRKNCPGDCTHQNSACGNGVCENNANSLRTNYYEDAYNCPVDCKKGFSYKYECGDGICSVTESCFTCPKDCGTCANVCGDSKCTGTETCLSCPRDCGRCPVVPGDGKCDYPFDAATSTDCASLAPRKIFKLADGSIISSMDNATAKATGTTGCQSTTFYKIPSGWVLAPRTPNLVSAIQKDQFNFGTGCLAFADGTTQVVGGAENENCGTLPLLVDGNGGYRLPSDSCPVKLLMQTAKTAIVSLTNAGIPLQACHNDCSGNGACDTVSGKCYCNAPWTGAWCDRLLGEFQIPPPAADWYKPIIGQPWQWILKTENEVVNAVEFHDIDFDFSRAFFKKLKESKKKIGCYFSAGTYEQFRSDQAMFPADSLGGTVSFGTGDSFADEKWLNIKRLDLIADIMLQRIEEALIRGCDIIEFDNQDPVIHDTGLKNNGKISLDLNLAYLKWLVGWAHARGMGALLKNSNEFAAYTSTLHDGVVNEECWINGNCDNYWPFLQLMKPVFNCEYFTTRFLSPVFAQTGSKARCGSDAANGKCGTALDPCCSDMGYCGRSSQHCGGGCQPKFSFNSNVGDAQSSCLAYRPGGSQCISGYYDFKDSTWLIPSDAYNGNPKAADFTIDRQGLDAQNVQFNPAGGIYMQLRRPEGNNPGVGVRISSTAYLPYGKLSASVQQSGVPGAVTSFITMADGKDEIDWEWTGDKQMTAQSNYFTSKRNYGKGQNHNMTSSTVTTAHVYGVDWNADRIIWTIDGAVVRTVTKVSDPQNFPTDPSRVQIGIWDGGASDSDGTSQWAGGRINWGTRDSVFAGVNWVKIQCPGDPEPTGPPTRPAGFKKPDMYAAAKIDSVVEGTSDYVKGTVGTAVPLPSPAPNGGGAVVPVGSGSVEAGIVTFGLLLCGLISAAVAIYV